MTIKRYIKTSKELALYVEARSRGVAARPSRNPNDGPGIFVLEGPDRQWKKIAQLVEMFDEN